MVGVVEDKAISAQPTELELGLAGLSLAIFRCKFNELRCNVYAIEMQLRCNIDATKMNLNAT